jgi:hypothetical protein
MVRDRPGRAPDIRARGYPAFAGRLSGDSQSATLLIHPRSQANAVTLERNGSTVASAVLVYRRSR